MQIINYKTNYTLTAKIHLNIILFLMLSVNGINFLMELVEANTDGPFSGLVERFSCGVYSGTQKCWDGLRMAETNLKYKYTHRVGDFNIF